MVLYYFFILIISDHIFFLFDLSRYRQMETGDALRGLDAEGVEVVVGAQFSATSRTIFLTFTQCHAHDPCDESFNFQLKILVENFHDID